MLDSLKITTRQSEIREKLAELAAIEKPEDAQVEELRSLDGEYKTNETRFRAALVVEEGERTAAGVELENRSDTERADILAGFEIRQVAAYLVEGKALDGALLHGLSIGMSLPLPTFYVKRQPRTRGAQARSFC